MSRALAFPPAFLATLLWAGVDAGGQQTQPAPSPNSTVAGELVIEPPTLINLGFEWFIQRDANRNATVAVSFRKQGETAWREALPLLRLQGERVYAESRVDVIAPNMFAGSVFDHQPATAYDVQLVLTDPDGVKGEARRSMRNMFINHASHAFCNQPTLGGPVYWIRNIAYHLPAGSTRLTNGAAGVLFTTTRSCRRPPRPARRTRIGVTT